MLQEEFRARLNAYRRPTGIPQTALARELGLHPNVLSHKLNGIAGSRLTHQEVKQIIKALAAWEAISRRAEAEELLALMDLKPATFSSLEWNSLPLNQLEVESPRSQAQVSFSMPGSGGQPVRGSLPAQPNPFIGREWALGRVGELLKSAGVRILTLTGVGGTGKTRLALRVAQECKPAFEDGVYFVDLSPLTNPTRLAATITKTLGLPETGQDPARTLKNHLATRQILLILDNFEQILAGAALVGELIEAAPRLKILVTSREVLRLYGEYQFGVPPLDLPDLAQLPALENLELFESIRLFVERARAVNSEFHLTEKNGTVVAEICTYLEGLPLAIELAAARVRLLPPEVLLARLKTVGERYRLLTGGSRNQPERQQTLKKAIEWSFGLLTGPEQQLFRRLAVFVNGWSEEAAAKICLDPAETTTDLLELLGSLVDKSLVQVQAGLTPQPRFRMLETLREYAMEQLVAAEELENIRQKHAGYFMRLTERLVPDTLAGQGGDWAWRLEEEHDNLRAALAWVTEMMARPVSPDREMINLPLPLEPGNNTPAEIGLRLGASLWRFWMMRGYFSEGRRWLEQIAKPLTVQLDGGVGPSQALYLGKLYHGTGILAFYQNDYATAAAAYEQSLNYLNQAGNRLGLAELYEALAQLARTKGNYGYARQMYQAALDIYKSLNNIMGVGNCFGNFSMALWHEGSYREAQAMMLQNLEMTRQHGFDYGVALMKIGLGMVALSLDELDQGRCYFEEATEVLRNYGQRRYLTTILLGLSYTNTREGDFARAEAFLKEGFAILTGSQLSDRWLIAWYFEWMGDLALAKGAFAQAVRLLGAADYIFKAIDVPRIAFVQTVHDRTLAQLKAQLNPTSLAKFWLEGAAFSANLGSAAIWDFHS